MKKSLAFIALLMAFVLCFTACSKEPAGSPNPDTNTPSAPSAPSTPDFDTSRNVSVTVREDGSGTKSAFMELIDLKEKADPPGAIVQTGTAGVLAEVKSNPSAIAYESLGYVTDEVKMLTVDGVEATTGNIQCGEY